MFPRETGRSDLLRGKTDKYAAEARKVKAATLHIQWIRIPHEPWLPKHYIKVNRLISPIAVCPRVCTESPNLPHNFSHVSGILHTFPIDFLSEINMLNLTD